MQSLSLGTAVKAEPIKPCLSFSNDKSNIDAIFIMSIRKNALKRKVNHDLKTRQVSLLHDLLRGKRKVNHDIIGLIVNCPDDLLPVICDN